MLANSKRWHINYLDNRNWDKWLLKLWTRHHGTHAFHDYLLCKMSDVKLYPCKEFKCWINLHLICMCLHAHIYLYLQTCAQLVRHQMFGVFGTPKFGVLLNIKNSTGSLKTTHKQIIQVLCCTHVSTIIFRSLLWH